MPDPTPLANAVASAVLAVVDTNGDKKLTIADLDVNKDRIITPSDLKSAVAKLDLNKDGKVDRKDVIYLFSDKAIKMLIFAAMSIVLTSLLSTCFNAIDGAWQWEGFLISLQNAAIIIIAAIVAKITDKDVSHILANTKII